MKGGGEKTQWKLFIEDVSVFQLVLTFLFMGVAGLLLIVYLMFTTLWPISVLYFTWQIYDWHKPERGGRRSAFVRSWKMWTHFKEYFPVKLVKTAELSPSKNYILGCHPHGIMSMGAFSCFSTEAGGFSEAYPGVQSTLAILAGLFRLPIFRDYILLAGMLPVSKESLEYKLSRAGLGNALVIIIGGAEESLACSPGANTVVMKHRKGFVRLALENGADLVPVYSFGENELFPQVLLSEGSVGRKLQALFKQVMGFARAFSLGFAGCCCPTRGRSLPWWAAPYLCLISAIHLKSRWTTITHCTWRPYPNCSILTKPAVDWLKHINYTSFRHYTHTHKPIYSAMKKTLFKHSVTFHFKFKSNYS
uniref:Acyltransferase n=1 Tax=Astyanax mexicanus TaxID=7994 RepID=A0A3B1JW60_ASTMX